MNNPVRNLISARVKRLASLLEESKSISHGATVGSLRESYLRSFLRDMVPQHFAVTSGFLTDSKTGTVTPQLDLVAIERSAMPRFALDEQTEIIPVESAYFLSEIKSTLETKHLAQIRDQMTAVFSLKYNYYRKPCCDEGISNELQQKIPMFVLAYENKLGTGRIEKWFSEVQGLIAVCIVNDKIVHVDQEATVKPSLISIDADVEHNEIFRLLELIYLHLATERENRRPFIPNWAAYISSRPHTKSR